MTSTTLSNTAIINQTMSSTTLSNTTLNSNIEQLSFWYCSITIGYKATQYFVFICYLNVMMYYYYAFNLFS